MITIEEMKAFRVGDSVHDMHYGLPELGPGIGWNSCTEFPCENGSKFIEDAVNYSIFYSGTHEFSYHNKILVVIKVLQHRKRGTLLVTLLYSYDNRRFGVVVLGVDK